MLGCVWEGDGESEIRRVASLEDAGEGDLAFASGPSAVRNAAKSRATCLLVPEDFDNATQRTLIRTRAPRATAARAIAQLHPVEKPEPGIHPSAVIAEGARVETAVSIGPLVSMGRGARVGARSSVG